MFWPDEPLPLEGLLDEPVRGPPPVEPLDGDCPVARLPLVSVPGLFVELPVPEPLVPEPLVPEPLVPDVPGAPLSPSPAPVPFVPV